MMLLYDEKHSARITNKRGFILMKMNKFLIVCMMFLLVFASLSPSVYAESASSAIEKEATRLWDNWDAEKMDAKQLLSAADKAFKKYPITKYKDSYKLLEISAFANMQLDNYATVEKQAATIIKYAPKEHYGYFLMGNAQYNLDKYAAAEKSLKKAISLDPEFAASYDWLGAVYANTKKYNAAATYTMRAVMLSPYGIIDSLSGYEKEKVYDNQFLGFTLDIKPTYTYSSKDELSSAIEERYAADPKGMMANPGQCLFDVDMLMNEMFIQKGDNNELSIAIEGQLYKNPKDVGNSTEVSESFIEYSKENRKEYVSNFSEVSKTKLGTQEFSTYTYDRVLDKKTYKCQVFVSVRDGVVTTLTIWAQNPDDISKGRAVLDTYKSY